MKKILNSGIVMLIFCSCQKEITQKSTSTINHIFAVSQSDARIGSHANGKMVQDCYVNSVGIYGSFDYVPALPIGLIYDQTSHRNVIFRSFVWFSVLDSIPQNAIILQALLILHTPSSNYLFPTGNTSYHGSTDTVTNAAIIRRPVSAWNERNISWLNQPALDTTDEVNIPESDMQWNWISTNDVTKIVQYEVTNRENFGFGMVSQIENSIHMMLFNNSETKKERIRPEIHVRYTLKNTN